MSGDPQYSRCLDFKPAIQILIALDPFNQQKPIIMKNKFLVLAIIASGIFLTSCSKRYGCYYSLDAKTPVTSQLDLNDREELAQENSCITEKEFDLNNTCP